MYSKILATMRKVLGSGESPGELARAASIGVYVAFSPFPGFHTVMILLIRWFTRLNLPTMFIFASINNPWTMIPFYTFDYVFGYWFTHSLLGWSDTWVISLEKVFGLGKICMLSFLVGGNVLGIIFGILSYPILKFIFQSWMMRARV